MEWDAPCVILRNRPYGEADAVVSVLAAGQGRHGGLARGAQSRTRAATWQPGNLVQVRWIARLDDQLGSMTGELVHASAASVLDDAMDLAILRAACAVTDGALPEREPHPRVLEGLLSLLAGLGRPGALAAYVRWEVLLLADLGYGLDLAACAVTGDADVRYVSPRTGRAVSAAAAGAWTPRLLPLPGFLIRDEETDAAAIRDGLALTGRFLERDAFGAHHRPVPAARVALADRVGLLVASP